MQLNQASDYALRAVMYLASRPDGEAVTAQAMAEEESIPMRFLLKIMRALVQAGIVRSYRGIHGGYALARRPKEVTLLDVVEAVEGPIGINRCLVDPAYCSKDGVGRCAIHSALTGIQAQLRSALAESNFGDLVRAKGGV